VFNAKRFFFLRKKSKCKITIGISRNRRDVQNAVPKKRQSVKMHQRGLKSFVTIAVSTIPFRFSRNPDAPCCAKNVTIPAVHGAGTPKK
jgi:hypothetical protein